MTGPRFLDSDATILGLRAASDMAYKAIKILATPWDPAKSTAQPPIVCGHARVQFQRYHRPPRWACSVCGHETGPR